MFNEPSTQVFNRVPDATAAQARRHAGQIVRAHRRGFGWIALWQCAAAVAGATVPWLVGRLVGRLSSGEATLASVDAICLGLVVAVVVEALCVWAAQRHSAVVAENVFFAVRNTFVQAVTKLPISVVERNGTGDLVSRSTKDVQELSAVIRMALPMFVITIAQLVVTVVAAIVVGGPVAVVLLVAVPIVVAANRWYLRRARRGYLREGRSHAAYDAALVETADSVRTVDALAVGGARRRVQDDWLRRIFTSERYTRRLRVLFWPWVDFGVMVPLVLAIVWGWWLLGQGWASIAQVTAVALYVAGLARPVGAMTDWLNMMQTGEVSLSRLQGVSLVPQEHSSTDAEPTGSVLRVQDAHFLYQAGVPVLQGVSLTVRPGERLAIVGPSGAGKSTLGRLLAGVNAPTSGAVTVGGVPVAHLPAARLHQEVALLTQEYHVFVGTVRDNLTLAKPAATDAQVQHALEVVLAWDWVAQLPGQLDAEVGTGGITLDPAQAQQLALARVVLADPHTVILDEATSLLDPGAARGIEQALANLLAGRTVIAIAHRLHTAQDADRVAVVEGGQVVELGSHTELLAAGGSYAQLWRAWCPS